MTYPMKDAKEWKFKNSPRQDFEEANPEIAKDVFEAEVILLMASTRINAQAGRGHAPDLSQCEELVALRAKVRQANDRFDYQFRLWLCEPDQMAMAK